MNSTYDGILILGAPRSGTTLMRRLLNAHADIHCPPETYLFGAASRFLQSWPSAGGLDVGVLDGLQFAGFEPDETISRLRQFVFSFLSEAAQKAGKKIWAEKTATDIFHLDRISQLCGSDCRYIGITRHPFDVIPSQISMIQKMDLYMDELHQYIQRHTAPTTALAHAWNDANQALLRLKQEQPENACIIKYEDLTQDPEQSLQTLFDFLERPDEPSKIVSQALQEKTDAGFGDWKTYQSTQIKPRQQAQEYDRWTQHRIGSICNPTLEALGYDAIELPKLPSKEMATRLFQMGRENAN